MNGYGTMCIKKSTHLRRRHGTWTRDVAEEPDDRNDGDGWSRGGTCGNLLRGQQGGVRRCEWHDGGDGVAASECGKYVRSGQGIPRGR